MKSELLSVISPVYNAESFVHRLLDSILEQDYPSIEMIAVDDGSKDNTLAVLESYVPKFEAKGYSLRVIHQENAGQSAAINNALKLVQGEYLAWPDSDDYLIDKRFYSKAIGVLSSTDDDVTMVRCLPRYENEETKEIKIKPNWDTKRTDLFEDCLWTLNGYWFQPIAYVAKMSAVDKFIPGREIYTEKEAGQNLQLMLPLEFRHKVLTINEVCVSVVKRADSHSGVQAKGYRKRAHIFNVYYRTKLAVLNSMRTRGDMCGYKKRTALYHAKTMLYLAKTNHAFRDKAKFEFLVRVRSPHFGRDVLLTAIIVSLFCLLFLICS